MFKNHIDLIGFLGSDPEQRQLENGAQLTSLSLATKASWKTDSGSYDSRLKLAFSVHPSLPKLPEVTRGSRGSPFSPLTDAEQTYRSGDGTTTQSATVDLNSSLPFDPTRCDRHNFCECLYAAHVAPSFCFQSA